MAKRYAGADFGDFFIVALIAALAILVVVAIVKSSGSTWISSGASKLSEMLEGFGTPNVTLKCPQGYKFFNDAAGASFCCKGEVNPYTHTCAATSADGICAFAPGTPDPRGGATLPLCGAVIDTANAEARESFCPPRLQNYATSGKCCASSTSVDGTDCSPLDLADKNMYCVISGAPKAGEKLCANLKMEALGTCPTGLRKVGYELGERERARYGVETDGVVMPVCLGVDAVCIPDEAITELNKKGIFGDKNIATWKYSCSGYNTAVVRRDTTVAMDNTYV